MPSENRSFGDELARQEPLNPALREKYESELQNMFEKKLNIPQKVLCYATAAFALAMAVLFGWLAFSSSELPPIVRWTWAAGALFGLLWVAMMARILMKGRIHTVIDESAQGGWAWAVSVLITVSMLILAGKNPDATRSVFMVVSALVFLIGGAVALVLAGINKTEMTIRERMLEMEYQIAEMSEHLSQQGSTQR